MSSRKLQKWHGAGNDFLVDVVHHGATPWWTPERAVAVCDRHLGVGADGLLIAKEGPTVEMVLFNADGSTAEMSGNGIRCLAAAVHKFQHANWTDLDVTTAAGIRNVQLSMNGDRGYGSVDMGEVTVGRVIPDSLGVANVGNPHVIVRDEKSWTHSFREEIVSKIVSANGPANVEFVTVHSRSSIAIHVFERGVGWTQACGTGSCATAAVLRDLGEVDDSVTVANPGGELHVSLNGHKATLSGPVQFVADLEWLEA
jgi:diaminopimelate epimerase